MRGVGNLLVNGQRPRFTTFTTRNGRGCIHTEESNMREGGATEKDCFGRNRHDREGHGGAGSAAFGAT